MGHVNTLADLAFANARERIRAAVGPCAGLCAERHADLIAAVVTRRPAPPVLQLSDHLQSRARRIAGQRKRDGLVTKRSIA